MVRWVVGWLGKGREGMGRRKIGWGVVVVVRVFVVGWGEY